MGERGLEERQRRCREQGLSAPGILWQDGHVRVLGSDSKLFEAEIIFAVAHTGPAPPEPGARRFAENI